MGDNRITSEAALDDAGFKAEGLWVCTLGSAAIYSSSVWFASLSSSAIACSMLFLNIDSAYALLKMSRQSSIVPFQDHYASQQHQ